MSSFREGYNYIADNGSAYIAAMQGEDVGAYIDTVEEEIQKLVKDINAFEGTGKTIDFLKGDVAEFWHADTFNIDAALHKSTTRMEVPRSTELGSVDVQLKGGEAQFSLKYYKTGEASANAQAQSVLQGTHGRYGSSTEPLYADQIRVIPSDQIADAEAYLRRKISEESLKRPEQAQRYQETLEMLQDRVSDGRGNESVPLTEEQSRMLAGMAREGKASDDMLDMDEVKAEMLRQSITDICKAGLTAATIAVVLKTAPEVYAAINQLIRNGELDEGQFTSIGTTAAEGGTEGFIRGTVSASIMAYLKTEGIEIAPAIVGVATVIAVDTIKNAYKVACGEKTRRELSNELIKELYVSTCALIAGGVTQGIIQIPVFGYMLGSFIGSSIGSFTYEFGYKTAISFCVDTGFTMFGLVEQDYQLPKEIIEEIGIETFDYESFDYETFEVDSFEPDSFEIGTFELETLDISFLRRGVIGVSKVGYIA